MTLDEQRGILFVACKEGKIAALDAKNGGKLLANATFGSNLDFLGFNPHLSHLYIPSGQTAVLGIYGVNAVSATGQLSVSLTLLGSADTALGSKCITTDNADDIWVCNPNTGAVLQIKDTLPTSVH